MLYSGGYISPLDYFLEAILVVKPSWTCDGLSSWEADASNQQCKMKFV